MVSGIEKEGSSSEEEGTEWVSLDDVEVALRGLPTPLQTKVMLRVQGNASVGYIAEMKPEVADVLLKEVARRVFGFSLGDLDLPELREIEQIRKELGLSWKFNPSP